MQSTTREVRRPLRILHCLRAPVGGLFRHVLDLAREQAARGHAVGLLADQNTGDRLTEGRLAELAPALGLGVTRIAMARQPGPGDLQAIRFTSQHARRLGADVLHGHGAKGGAYARLAGRALRGGGERVRTFYTPHGGSLNYAPGTLEARVFLGLEKVLVRYTDGLIFESAYAARKFAELVGPAGARSRVVPNGLAPADFAAHAPAPDATDFLFIGELRPIKGIDVLLEALAVVNARRPATLTVVGSGPDADALKSRTTALGLDAKVRFTGALPARLAFSMGRTMVVPSRAESFPYVVLEAGAAGIPLLTTDVGGIPEMLAGTDTPMLPAGNPDVLAYHMDFALENCETMCARARAFRAVVGERYTVAGMTSAILDFYAERGA